MECAKERTKNFSNILSFFVFCFSFFVEGLANSKAIRQCILKAPAGGDFEPRGGVMSHNAAVT